MIAGFAILAIFLLIILIRDEAGNSSTKESEPVQRSEERTAERLDSLDIETNRPIEDTLPSTPFYGKDYTEDNEFCKKYPCDFMVPVMLRSGRKTFKCTNVKMWKRWGIEDETMRDMNNGNIEQCARCDGIPCKGGHK